MALTVGPAAGIAVFLADLLKGTVCGVAGVAISGPLAGDVCVLAAVIGQIAPIFAGFRGGKGAATTLGGYLAVASELALLGLGCWAVGLLTIRRGVISTVTAIVALAFVTAILGEHQLLGVGAALITLVAHRTHLATWRRGEMPTIREALRDNRRQ